MTTPHNLSHRAYELQQQGFTLQQIAAELDTSDDRASQLIASYQRQQTTEPQKLWWHGLSPSTRVFLEDMEMHSRAAVEEAHREGLFTTGHACYLSGMTARRRKRIIEWLNQPVQPCDASQAEYPMDETITLRMQADTVRELERLARVAGVKPDELVEMLIIREAEGCASGQEKR